MLGIVGDSASGKTTLTRGLVSLFGEENVSAICCDDYHRYNRKQRKEMGITALDPACNYVDIMEQHFRMLRAGEPILKPVYNHSTGDFDPPEYVRPRRFVIVEGLLGFHSRAMRNCFDIKVYLNPSERLRAEWKIKRDTTKRGYTREQVLAALAQRAPDAEAFIHPQRAHADLVVQFYPPPENLRETGRRLNARLVLRPTIPHPDFTPFLPDERANGATPSLRMELGRDAGKPADILEVSGNTTPEETTALRRRLREHLLPEDFNGQIPEGAIGIYYDGQQKRQSYPLALTQLLIAFHMIQAQEQLQGKTPEPAAGVAEPI
ncbi:phosphoribulokinase [Rhodocaloribacter sp.]